MEERVRKGKTHISPADKGKGMVAMPLSMYEKLVEEHTKNDVEVNWKEIEEAQREVRAHGHCIARIFSIAYCDRSA